jgi:hypothetical protein
VNTAIAEEAYAALGPITVPEPENDYPLRALCNAIGSMFAQAEQTARSLEGAPPYAQAWDVNRCPDWLLPFLGQAVGVRVVPGVSPTQQRTEIREEAAWKRGWQATLIARIQATLTGTKRVRMTERNAGAWTLLIVTNPEETPNPALTERVAKEWTPMGITPVSFATSVQPIIDEGTREIDKATEASIDTVTLAQVT